MKVRRDLSWDVWPCPYRCCALPHWLLNGGKQVKWSGEKCRSRKKSILCYSNAENCASMALVCMSLQIHSSLHIYSHSQLISFSSNFHIITCHIIPYHVTIYKIRRMAMANGVDMTMTEMDPELASHSLDENEVMCWGWDDAWIIIKRGWRTEIMRCLLWISRKKYMANFGSFWKGNCSWQLALAQCKRGGKRREVDVDFAVFSSLSSKRDKGRSCQRASYPILFKEQRRSWIRLRWRYQLLSLNCKFALLLYNSTQLQTY